MSVNVNEEGFHRRLDAVQKILDHYGLKSSAVTPIAYVDYCPFPFNNFLYKVDLAEPAVPAHFPPLGQPCTTPPPPAGVSTLVIRLSNPHAEGLNNANRVENDVAAQHLARQSLAAAGAAAQVVPDVYAWAPCRFFSEGVSDEAGFGWTMCEYKPGADLDTQLPTLSLDDVQAVCEQLAAVVAALQRSGIPDSVTQFGALSIGGVDGQELVSGQMALLQGGPWDTYADLWTAKLRLQLTEAAESALLQGWTPGGLRERLEAFLALGGLHRVLEGVDVHQKVLVHGDLTTNNILYDSTSKQITGVVDFDWACVTHPCDEFLSGLWDLGGGIHARMGQLQPMVLSGDFSKPPQAEEGAAGDEAHRKWEVAKIWDDALRRAGALRPNTIAGVDRIKAIKDLEHLLCPFELANTVMLSRISVEEQATKRAAAEKEIVRWLDLYE